MKIYKVGDQELTVSPEHEEQFLKLNKDAVLVSVKPTVPDEINQSQANQENLFLTEEDLDWITNTNGNLKDNDPLKFETIKNKLLSGVSDSGNSYGSSSLKNIYDPGSQKMYTTDNSGNVVSSGPTTEEIEKFINEVNELDNKEKEEEIKWEHHGYDPRGNELLINPKTLEVKDVDGNIKPEYSPSPLEYYRKDEQWGATYPEEAGVNKYSIVSKDPNGEEEKTVVSRDELLYNITHPETGTDFVEQLVSGESQLLMPSDTEIEDAINKKIQTIAILKKPIEFPTSFYDAEAVTLPDGRLLSQTKEWEDWTWKNAGWNEEMSNWDLIMPTWLGGEEIYDRWLSKTYGGVYETSSNLMGQDIYSTPSDIHYFRSVVDDSAPSGLQHPTQFSNPDHFNKILEQYFKQNGMDSRGQIHGDFDPETETFDLYKHGKQNIIQMRSGGEQADTDYISPTQHADIVNHDLYKTFNYPQNEHSNYMNGGSNLEEFTSTMLENYYNDQFNLTDSRGGVIKIRQVQGGKDVLEITVGDGEPFLQTMTIDGRKGSMMDPTAFDAIALHIAQELDPTLKENFQTHIMNMFEKNPELFIEAQGDQNSSQAQANFYNALDMIQFGKHVAMDVHGDGPRLIRTGTADLLSGDDISWGARSFEKLTLGGLMVGLGADPWHIVQAGHINFTDQNGKTWQVPYHYLNQVKSQYAHPEGQLVNVKKKEKFLEQNSEHSESGYILGGEVYTTENVPRDNNGNVIGVNLDNVERNKTYHTQYLGSWAVGKKYKALNEELRILESEKDSLSEEDYLSKKTELEGELNDLIVKNNIKPVYDQDGNLIFKDKEKWIEDPNTPGWMLLVDHDGNQIKDVNGENIVKPQGEDDNEEWIKELAKVTPKEESLQWMMESESAIVYLAPLLLENLDLIYDDTMGITDVFSQLGGYATKKHVEKHLRRIIENGHIYNENYPGYWPGEVTTRVLQFIPGRSELALAMNKELERFRTHCKVYHYNVNPLEEHQENMIGNALNTIFEAGTGYSFRGKPFDTAESQDLYTQFLNENEKHIPGFDNIPSKKDFLSRDWFRAAFYGDSKYRQLGNVTSDIGSGLVVLVAEIAAFNKLGWLASGKRLTSQAAIAKGITDVTRGVTKTFLPKTLSKSRFLNGSIKHAANATAMTMAWGLGEKFHDSKNSHTFYQDPITGKWEINWEFPVAMYAGGALWGNWLNPKFTKYFNARQSKTVEGQKYLLAKYHQDKSFILSPHWKTHPLWKSTVDKVGSAVTATTLLAGSSVFEQFVHDIETGNAKNYEWLPDSFKDPNFKNTDEYKKWKEEWNLIKPWSTEGFKNTYGTFMTMLFMPRGFHGKSGFFQALKEGALRTNIHTTRSKKQADSIGLTKKMQDKDGTYKERDIRESANKKIKEVNKKIDKIIKDKKNGKIDNNKAKEQIKKLEIEKKKLKEAKEDLIFRNLMIIGQKNAKHENEYGKWISTRFKGLQVENAIFDVQAIEDIKDITAEDLVKYLEQEGSNIQNKLPLIHKFQQLERYKQFADEVAGKEMTANKKKFLEIIFEQQKLDYKIESWEAQKKQEREKQWKKKGYDADVSHYDKHIKEAKNRLKELELMLKGTKDKPGLYSEMTVEYQNKVDREIALRKAQFESLTDASGMHIFNVAETKRNADGTIIEGSAEKAWEEMLKKEDMVDTGGEGFVSGDGMRVYINAERMQKYKTITSAVHEMIHVVLWNHLMKTYKYQYNTGKKIKNKKTGKETEVIEEYTPKELEELRTSKNKKDVEKYQKIIDQNNKVMGVTKRGEMIIERIMKDILTKGERELVEKEVDRIYKYESEIKTDKNGNSFIGYKIRNGKKVEKETRDYVDEKVTVLGDLIRKGKIKRTADMKQKIGNMFAPMVNKVFGNVYKYDLGQGGSKRAAEEIFKAVIDLQSPNQNWLSRKLGIFGVTERVRQIAKAGIAKGRPTQAGAARQSNQGRWIGGKPKRIESVWLDPVIVKDLGLSKNTEGIVRKNMMLEAEVFERAKERGIDFVTKEHVPVAIQNALVLNNLARVNALAKKAWEFGEGIEKDRVTFEDFQSGYQEQLIKLSRTWNPMVKQGGKIKEVPFGAYMNSLLPRRYGDVLKGEKSKIETKSMVTEEGKTREFEDAYDMTGDIGLNTKKPQYSKLRQDLGLSKEMMDIVTNAVIKTIGRNQGVRGDALPDINTKEFKVELTKAFRSALKKPIQDLMGSRENYDKFLIEHFKSIYEALPKETLVQMEKDVGGKKDIEKGYNAKRIFTTSRRITKVKEVDRLISEGKLPKQQPETGRTMGPQLHTKNPFPGTEKVLAYFRGKNMLQELGYERGGSTLGTRKDKLAMEMGVELAFDATMDVLAMPEVIKKRKDILELQELDYLENEAVIIAKQIDRNPNGRFSNNSRINSEFETALKLDGISKREFIELTSRGEVEVLQSRAQYSYEALRTSYEAKYGPQKDFENKGFTKLMEEFGGDLKAIIKEGGHQTYGKEKHYTHEDFTRELLETYKIKSKSDIKGKKVKWWNKELVKSMMEDFSGGTNVYNPKGKGKNIKASMLEFIPKEFGTWETSMLAAKKGNYAFLFYDLLKGGSPRGNSIHWIDNKPTYKKSTDAFRERLAKGKMGDLMKDNPVLVEKWKKAMKAIKNLELSESTIKYQNTLNKELNGLIFEKGTPVPKKLEIAMKKFNPKSVDAAFKLYDAYMSSHQAWFNHKVNVEGWSKKKAIQHIIVSFQSNANFTKGLRALAPTVAVWFPKGSEVGIPLKLKGEHIFDSSTFSANLVNAIYNNNFLGNARSLYTGFRQALVPKKYADKMDKLGGENSPNGNRRFVLIPEFGKQVFDLKTGKSMYDLELAEYAKETSKVLAEAWEGSKNVKLAEKINQGIRQSMSGKKRGMSTFDFDDTMAYTKSGVRVRVPNPSGTPKPRRKVIFMAGGAGSGKSNVVKKLGLEKDGFKIVNSDISLEWLKKNHGLPESMKDLTKEQRSLLGKLGHQARKIAKNKMMKYQGNAEGVIVDGTGGSMKMMEKLVTEFKDKGYDVSMMFVETTLKTAMARNKARKERSLLDVIVRKNHEAVQKNKPGFKTLFGDRFMEVKTDKLTMDSPMPKKLVSKMKDFVNSYEKLRLDAAEFAAKGKEISDRKGEFDFSEFNKVVEGTEGPYLKTAIERAKKYGTKDMFVLTARPAASAGPIREFLRSQGLNIPLENITGLGNSTGAAKAKWMLEKFAEGYNDMYFVDDAMGNVKAVKKVLDQLDIKSEVIQAKGRFSNNMNIEFNNMLERQSGLDAIRKISLAEAKMIGKGKGKFDYWIPPSAEDFRGLIYKLLGKGEQGNKDMRFFEKSLFEPFAKGIKELTITKQKMVEEYKQLKKVSKNVKLNKKVEGTVFDVDAAIRIYLWDKAGHTVPDIGPELVRKLADHVKNTPELLTYAETLSSLSRSKDIYTKPSEHWMVESIASDLNQLVKGETRQKFLQEWIDNKNVIFSKENLNKLEAIHGKWYREALENMLYRMETGTNRISGKDGVTKMWYDWINGSVGATMFWNTRSAVLQTISMVNFTNMAENSVYHQAKAFANQKQFWKDFAFIMNSPMLKQRRGGLEIDVSASELTNMFEKSGKNPKAILKYFLEKGFTPTRIADSFAIAMGGSGYYRNRVNMYLKRGLSEFKAKEKAWLDFQEMAERTQQSSRPDLISQQQAGPLGRIILAWQNTPMQMTRLMKKKLSDLVNRRKNEGQTQFQSDMSNLSGILYYGAMQNLWFMTLQSGLAWIMFGSDMEDKIEQKEMQVLNGAFDTLLRGTGVYGAAFSTLKNTILRYQKEQEKPKWKRDHANTIIEALNLSPPIGSKVRKAYSAIKTWEYNEGVGKELGFRVENPNFHAYANLIEAGLNIPLARLINKANNLEEAITGNHETWQRIAMISGWSRWNVGVKDEELEAAKDKAYQRKEDKRKYEELIKKKQKEKEKEIEKKKEEEKKKAKGIKTVRCSGTNSSGSRCGMTTETDKKSWKCFHHAAFKDGMDRDGDGIKEYQCTGRTTSGRRCKNKTENKNKKCYAHQ